jgi:hypothetical protein
MGGTQIRKLVKSIFCSHSLGEYMSTYRDPVYRSIMAQQPFKLVEGAAKAPVYDGYMVPVLPSPMLGSVSVLPSPMLGSVAVLPSPMLGGYTYKQFTPIQWGGMGGFTFRPFTPVDRGGNANYYTVNDPDLVSVPIDTKDLVSVPIDTKSMSGMGNGDVANFLTDVQKYVSSGVNTTSDSPASGGSGFTQQAAFQMQDDIKIWHDETLGLSSSLSAGIDATQPSAMQLLVEQATFSSIKPKFESLHKFLVSMANELYEQTKTIFNNYTSIPDGQMTSKQLEYYWYKYQAIDKAHKDFQNIVNKVISDPLKYVDAYQDPGTFNLIFEHIAKAGGDIGKGLGDFFGNLFSSPTTWIIGGLAVYIMFFRK